MVMLPLRKCIFKMSNCTTTCPTETQLLFNTSRHHLLTNSSLFPSLLHTPVCSTLQLLTCSPNITQTLPSIPRLERDLDGRGHGNRGRHGDEFWLSVRRHHGGGGAVRGGVLLHAGQRAGSRLHFHPSRLRA